MARFEQVGGERMPEQMWIDVGIDALSTGPVIDTGLYRACADARAAVAHEQRLFVRSGHLWPRLMPLCERCERFPANWDNAVLITLAGYVDHGGVAVYIVAVKTGELGQA